MSKIDVHCLTYKASPFFPLLKRQMKEENVSFHVIQNGDNIGEGRVRGFLIGDNPYLSFVDDDDLIQPGIFQKVEEVLFQGYDWVYTDEYLIDKDGDWIQPGWSSNPELYSPELLHFMEVTEGVHCHHLLIFKRELLTPYLIFIMLQLKELAESFLMKELGRHPNLYHLKEVGYYWRQHEENTFKSFRCYQFFENLRKEEEKDGRVKVD